MRGTTPRLAITGPISAIIPKKRRIASELSQSYVHTVYGYGPISSSFSEEIYVRVKALHANAVQHVTLLSVTSPAERLSLEQ